MNDVIVVGGGLSGMTATITLQQNNVDAIILESTERLGGRVKTDLIDGFLLNRGFHVFNPSYPEVHKWLDIKELDLKHFLPGALILADNGKIKEFMDVSRKWSALIPSFFSNIGNFQDKTKLLFLRNKLLAASINDIFSSEEMSTKEYLKKLDFSETFVKNFFQPFFSGVFLENNLSTSQRMFEFTFKMFCEGNTSLPSRGIEQIPNQLSKKINKKSIFCNEKVISIDQNKIITESGHEYSAKKIIIASEATSLARILGKDINTNFKSVNCLYFSTNVSPLKKNLIAINASKNAFINNVAVISDIAPDYAPKSKSLISVSINNLSEESDEILINKVLNELQNWFGLSVHYWNFIKCYRIRYALPQQRSVNYSINDDKFKIDDTRYICGDHILNGSIDGALLSGRKCAELVIKDLRK